MAAQNNGIVFLESVGSTNTWLRDQLVSTLLNDEEKKRLFPHLFTVCTYRQTAGRGQQGNSWESEPDKNISFTTLLDTSALRPEELWRVTEVCSLAVRQALCSLGINAVIKWPNDIYAGNEKICGILIESVLHGSSVACCLAGIGVNINQTVFRSSAPNPTSMALVAGHEFDKETVLRNILTHLHDLWHLVSDSPSQLKEEYMQALYRCKGFFPYRKKEVSAAPMSISSEVDAEVFEAEICDINEQGCLVLRRRDGTTETFHFKQIQYIIPTK